ncbi:MAG: hypothetical protein CMH53_10810 [Myxococcales bacterium]|nr:hypothetical protein [Myxococcales bacterium]
MTQYAPAQELAAEVSTDARRKSADRAITFVFAATMIIALLWQGGVHQSAMWAIWALTAIAWLLSLSHPPSATARLTLPWLWIGLGAYHALQVLPLPHGIVELLNPNATQISDASRRALGLAPASMLPIATTPAETAAQGSIFLMVGSIVALYGHHLMRPKGRKLASRHGLFIGILCGACALLWGLSYAPWMSKLVPVGLRWTLREFALINPNHQGGVCAVGLALMMRSVLRTDDLAKRNIYLLGAVFLGGVALLTRSKGGVLGCLFVTLGSLATMRHRWRNSRMAKEELRRRARVEFGLKISTAGLIIGLLMVPFIEGEILPELSGGKQINKVELLQQASGLIGQGWATGEGAGSLPVLAAIRDVAPGKRIDFMENVILQRLLDQGLIGALLFFIVLAAMLARTMSTMVRGAAGWGPWLAICALLLQNLADFSIELTFGMLLLLPLSVQVERLHVRGSQERSKHRSRRKYRKRLLLGTAVAIALSAGLLHHGSNHWSRGMVQRFSPLSIAQAKGLTEQRYLHSDFAFLSLCRKAVKARQFKQALIYCDRAIELRPQSQAARLLRMATTIDDEQDGHIAEDLAMLLAKPSKERNEAIEMCGRYEIAEKNLLKIVADLPNDVALHVARQVFELRPDLIEKMVLQIRQRSNSKTSPVEFLLARVYIKRGHERAADRIATKLIGNPHTNKDGWEIQAELLLRAKKYRDAFTLFASVCKARLSSSNACIRALMTARLTMSYSEALRYASKIYILLRLVPEHAYIHWMTIAQLHYDNQQFERAIAASRRALGLKRNDPKALILEARSHLAISDWRAANHSIKLLPKEGPWATVGIELANEASRTRGGHSY